MFATHIYDLSFIHDTDLNKDSLTTNSKRFKLVLHRGNVAMLVAAVGMLLSIFVGYAEQFSLLVQVTSHITLILCATVIKVDYIMRCIGLHGLGTIQL